MWPVVIPHGHHTHMAQTISQDVALSSFLRHNRGSSSLHIVQYVCAQNVLDFFSQCWSIIYMFFPAFSILPLRPGTGEPQHHLHLQRSGDELQRRCRRRLRQPDVSRRRRGRPGRHLRKPRARGGQRDPEQPEVTRRLHFPQHLARRDTTSTGSDGGAASEKVKIVTAVVRQIYDG